MMIGNLLRVKDLPTNGEDSSRARAPHHLSIANTKKRPPRRRETKKATARSQREREREREKQKKERSPAAGDDPHWPTLLCGWCVDPTHKFTRQNSTRVVVLSSFESAQRAASVNVLLSFVFLFDVNHQTTTKGVPSSPGRGGGEQRRVGLRLNVVLFFFAGKEEKNFLKP